MKGRKTTSSWDSRPQGNELQQLVEEFGITLKEPDGQHAAWGYKWVLSYPGNELPLSEEGKLWAHFGMYVQWQSDIALLCRCVATRYPELNLTERSSIRTWVEQGASWDNLPLALGTEVQGERLQPGDPWAKEWLVEARKHALDQAFFGHTRVVDRLFEVIDRLDVQMARDALDVAIPSGKSMDPSPARL